MSLEVVPSALKEKKHWVVWRAIKDDNGKVQKRPWNPNGINLLKWGNPLNHLTFDEAAALYQAGTNLPERNGKHFAGIGYILPPGTTEVRDVAVDLDDAIINGAIKEDALTLLTKCNSYSEISPSGNGIRIVGRAILPEDLKNISTTDGGEPLFFNGQKVEVFVRKHFFTVTGNKIDGYPSELRDITQIILELYALKTKEKKTQRAQEPSITTDDFRYKRYAERALEDETRKVRMASEGSRNIQLNNSALALGTLAQILDERDVRSSLIRAAISAGLPKEEAEATFKSGYNAGKKDPRNLPDDPAVEFEQLLVHEQTADETIDNEDVRKAALEILQQLDPVDAIVKSCSRMVLGAEIALKKLICCVAVQDIIQSEGLHPKMSGESGAGKTAAVMIFSHHLPKEAVLVGSMSNKAAFYHANGDRVFRILDDYQAGNEDLDTIIKQTTSLFHEKYQHRTVINQKAATLEIGSEQTWAITSVDSSQDIQVLNRQIPINVDDSATLTAKVNNRTIERYGRGERKFPEDAMVETCREMWRILREEGPINIRVPFWEQINWMDTSNRRNPTIFMDILIAHTAMLRHQRDIDSDGYYLATEDDFEFAKDLFSDKEAEELVKRLTRREREFAELLVKSPTGLTKKQVADALGVSANRVCQLAYGENGKGGLVQKLPGFSAEEITDTISIDVDEKRSIKKTLFTINKYNPLEGFDAVVKLDVRTVRKE